MRGLKNTLVFCLLCSQAAHAANALPPDLATFLGSPPANFEQKFRKPARELRAAFELLMKKKMDAGIQKLLTLTNSELAEHATYELAEAYRRKKEFSKSTAQGEKLLRLYPGSTYAERVRDLLQDNECDIGLANKGAEGTHALERCLWRTPWKSWVEHEEYAAALYGQLKASKDPLWKPFVSEFLQALPSSSPLRQKIIREIPGPEIDRLNTLARYRTKSGAQAGVKAIFPDADLMDTGMKFALQEKWRDAGAQFRQILEQYPQSEHLERAQFWAARCEEKLGHAEEAKKRFQQILSDNPFTYYGMQAAIAVGKDWQSAAEDETPLPVVKWEGSLLSRQALSLWRLRALIEAGVIDYARAEARFFANAKGNGAGVGQDNPRGALMMSRLFHESGNNLASFSHVYAALSLDPSLMNKASLSLIFPNSFREEFEDASEKSQVNPLLIASLVKQESAFLPDALSRADAMGLMQLLLGTANEMKAGTKREDLLKPSVNTQIGSLYLARLLNRFQGNIALALAAYNAGPSRAIQWQKDLAGAPAMKKGFDPDLFIDSIPFTETRKYVGNILRNYAWYKLLAKESKMGKVEELIFQWQKPNPDPVKTPAPAPSQEIQPEQEPESEPAAAPART